MNAIPPPYEHQRKTTEFILEHPGALVFNEPGTGKTRSCLDAIAELKRRGELQRALVLAPKSILEPSWKEDAQKFTPHLTVSVAYAQNRRAAFKAPSDVVITNHDAAKWIVNNGYADQFDMLICDESTAFKNKDAQRSIAVAKIAEQTDRVVAMTGTPIPNSILDIWHQAYLVDGGERLGAKYYAFRNTVCEPRQVGPQANMVQWVAREGAIDVVTDLLSDITILYRLEDCLDIPPNTMRTVPFTLNDKHRATYEAMVRDAVIELQSGVVSAVNAAAVATKLLQIASGAVYDSEKEYHVIDKARYELVIELALQRSHSIVAFQWKHQRDLLSAELERRKVPYAIIDGQANQRGESAGIVERFQNGELRVILAHPKSAGHGLTLTKGTAAIWASPTHSAEQFLQFNRRVFRAGQTQPTETILVEARDTIEEAAYARTQGKVGAQESMLDLVQSLIHLETP